DLTVTGVQTCALPISKARRRSPRSSPSPIRRPTRAIRPSPHGFRSRARVRKNRTKPTETRAKLPRIEGTTQGRPGPRRRSANMTLRLLVLLALIGAIGATPALAGGGYGDQKAHVDAKIAALHSKIARSQAKAASLSSQIGSLTTQIHALDQRVGNVSAELSSLQSDLALHEQRLGKLDALFHVQTVRYHYLKRQYALALERLNLRIVD